MKLLHNFTPSLQLGVDCVCIAFAIFYTCKQFIVYLENEDFSEISFQKFTEAGPESYPTYTICLEDSRTTQLYKKDQVVTHNFHGVCDISPTCPYGCFVFAEGNKLTIVNQTIPEGCLERHIPPPPMMLEQSPNYQTDPDIEYDLTSFGEQMIIIKGKNKTHIIGPEQYQDLLMGYAEPFNYSAQSPSLTDDQHEMEYEIKDVLDLNFAEATINMQNLLADLTIETENGSTYGWHTNNYKDITTYCKGDHHFVDVTFSFCEVEKSSELYFEKKINTEFPLDVVYQDPIRKCYSPTKNQSMNRNKNRVTFDLDKLVSDELGKSEIHPLMTIYIHKEGQFVRGMNKPIAEFTGKELRSHCLKSPMLPIPLDYLESNYEEIKKDCAGTRISFGISLVTLLRTRHDGRKPCNENLENEDSVIMNMMANELKLGCIPLYWKSLDISHDLQVCNETWQYRAISDVTSNFTYFGEEGMMGKIRSMFNPPCDEMIIVVNKREKRGRNFLWKDFNNQYIIENNETGLYLDMIFNNDNPRFQIIENDRSFTGESCWAGIGGFVGIFIGVSLRQIPELVLGFLDLMKKLLLMKM